MQARGRYPEEAVTFKEGRVDIMMGILGIKLIKGHQNTNHYLFFFFLSVAGEIEESISNVPYCDTAEKELGKSLVS